MKVWLSAHNGVVGVAGSNPVTPTIVIEIGPGFVDDEDSWPILRSQLFALKIGRLELGTSGCSAVRLAHLLREQGVGGSNPPPPTPSLPHE